MDSYNQTFDLDYSMDREEVLKLRDWLNAYFPPTINPSGDKG